MITGYLRPLTLHEATALVARPDVVIMAGGTSINSRTGRPDVTAVDLQALGLAGIEPIDASLRIGAMTRLQALTDSDLVPAVLRDLARREAPSTIRNAATVGGTIGAADPESELLAGLLAFGAVVTVARADSATDHTLDDLLDDPKLTSHAIMTSVMIPATGFAAAERTGRTPMDRPIVMAVARKDAEGSIRLALTGVAHTPIVADPDHMEDLDPPSDFRGSRGYRRHLAGVLAGRVLTALAEGEPA